MDEPDTNVIEVRSIKLGRPRDALRETDPKEETPSSERERGRRIAGARKRLALSQGELARRVGVSERTVGAWEAGNWPPEGGNVVRLADVLQRPTQWIMEGGDEVSIRLGEIQESLGEVLSKLEMLDHRIGSLEEPRAG